ncbi:DUF1266 domain-containing protein [Chitinophaga lutea]|uniref:DUF1266 domain-containing protein n=1 Tax=Chitinophaga lutea TaxID=2488634 RepID=A0A3N4PXL9_9BACT|nr:DUF1266 domain-containing protein [Chitinophaga lutea]RPE08827.1 DUF1266 domain-containing protein [Chitinophaga lutea]
MNTPSFYTYFLVFLAVAGMLILLRYVSRKKEKRRQEAADQQYLQSVKDKKGGENPYLPEMKADTGLSDDDQQNIAAGANLAFLNCIPLNTLGTGTAMAEVKIILEEDWGIESRDHLLNTISWLEGKGHRHYFGVIWKVMGDATAIEKLHGDVKSTGDKTDISWYADNIASGYRFLQEAGCFANGSKTDALTWDLGRAIALCRWGYDRQYLNEGEALYHIRRLGRQLRGHYTSWENLSENFMLGHVMWSGRLDDLANLHREHRTLLTAPSSPWVQSAIS